MQSVVEVVKFAIANEVNARTFYSRTADLAEHGDAKMVFVELTDMEDTHAQRLVDAFGGLLAEEGVDASAHLERLERDAEENLEDDQLRLLQEAEMRPVMDFAIAMEVKARDTYLSLKERIQDADLIDLCQRLADEEQGHHDQLAEARIGIETPPDERPML